MHAFRGSFALASCLALVACRQPAPPVVEPLPASEFVAAPETALRSVSPLVLRELLDDGDWPSLRQALAHDRAWLARQPADRILTFGPRSVSVEELGSALALVEGWLAEEPTPRELAQRLGEAFDPMVTVGEEGSRMLVTGYYEPLIAGSLRRTEEYDVPIYGPPPDLFHIELGDFRDEWRGRRVTGLRRGNRLLPYPDRREIRQGGRLRGREIAWARDPVDLFFVEVQGSGALVLPDGNEIRIGYAGANGRQYRSIGKLLIDEEKIAREEMSMQALRRYLEENPAEVERVLDYNESQVFFRRLDGAPVGSLGVPVTPGRSIAVDQSLLPPGALGFLLTEVPGIGENGETIVTGPLRRFVLNQDTGGAIRGADRADLFWGRGEEAALRAGLMKQPGKLFILVPKPQS
ncbi:MAG: MltA domain-containing protein [Acidobacteria bacterium]|nr:MltA domain-containing protein [Acidobacteriota bacterium]